MADVYYNEHDPFAAAWLRELIRAGHIAPGEVDTRSIVDVRPSDLVGFGQCHFFAGIGTWSHALRGAGWPDDRAVWTGSCPCQPFSNAGKRTGTADERHLWPAFFDLIRECRPRVVLGEQVASAAGLQWLDIVQSDLEGTGYAVGTVDLCAAGLGAPHIRQRLYWVADAASIRHQERGQLTRDPGDQSRPGATIVRCHGADVMADASASRLPVRKRKTVVGTRRRKEGRAIKQRDRAFAGALGHSDSTGCETCDAVAGGDDARPEQPSHSSDGIAWRPIDGFWRASDWLACRDNRWRPVEPGTFPLAHGATSRVGRLRGYGNALVAPVAQAFIEAVMECIP